MTMITTTIISSSPYFELVTVVVEEAGEIGFTPSDLNTFVGCSFIAQEHLRKDNCSTFFMDIA